MALFRIHHVIDGESIPASYFPAYQTRLHAREIVENCIEQAGGRIVRALIRGTITVIMARAYGEDCIYEIHRVDGNLDLPLSR